MAETGEIRCAMDHILEAERKGEINHDNVLYIVENINVAGTDFSSGLQYYSTCIKW
jgi:trans-cinnamate 4-monooxygenase